MYPSLIIRCHRRIIMHLILLSALFTASLQGHSTSLHRTIQRLGGVYQSRVSSITCLNVFFSRHLSADVSGSSSLNSCFSLTTSSANGAERLGRSSPPLLPLLAALFRSSIASQLPRINNYSKPHRNHGTHWSSWVRNDLALSLKWLYIACSYGSCLVPFPMGTSAPPSSSLRRPIKNSFSSLSSSS